MIYFNINVRNPWWGDRFKTIKTKFFETWWKHKHIEIQFTKDCELFRIEFEWNIRQDHAGIRLELGLLGYKASFTFYDSRHWNYDKGRWMFNNERI